MPSSPSRPRPLSPDPATPTELDLRLAVAAGLEPAAVEELSRFHGLASATGGRGGVSCHATLRQAAAIVLGIRTATRVVAVLARDLETEPLRLTDALAEIGWEDWLPQGVAWAARAVGTSGPLTSPRYAEQLVKDAIVRRFRRLDRTPPPVDRSRPRILVELRLDSGGAAAGIDLAGGSLHFRGTPRSTVAPLREDVAAGLAFLAGARGGVPLVDPFAGSGTLLAEAASVMLARPLARDPGPLALSRLPAFSAVDLEDVRERLAARCEPAAAPPILGVDRDEDAVRQARLLMARLGLAGVVELRVGRATDANIAHGRESGLVLTNPPWGRRLAGDEAAAWRELGTLARQLPGWTVAALSGDRGLTRHLGLRSSRRWPVMVGGVDARLCIYDIRARPA